MDINGFIKLSELRAIEEVIIYSFIYNFPVINRDKGKRT